MTDNEEPDRNDKTREKADWSAAANNWHFDEPLYIPNMPHYCHHSQMTLNKLDPTNCSSSKNVEITISFKVMLKYRLID